MASVWPGKWLLPGAVFGLLMLAFADGLFDCLPEPVTHLQADSAIAAAREMVREGEIARALHLLDRASSAIGETALILVEISACEMQLGQLDDAQRTLNRAIDQRVTELDAAGGVLDYRAPELPVPVSAGPAAAMSVQANAIGTAGAGADTVPAENGGPGQPARLRLLEPDELLSVAFTRLARIELQRAENMRRWGVPERGSVAYALAMANRVDSERESARRTHRALDLLMQAMRTHPGNQTARQMQAALADHPLACAD